jgi:hypothetical protein
MTWSPPGQRIDLKQYAIAQGLIEALLYVARSHKAQKSVSNAISCLYELALEQESWRRIAEAGVH